MSKINKMDLKEIKDIIEVMLEDLSSNLDEKKKKKKDRCHRKADSVYGTKTSAYKSGAIVKCRKGMIWKKKKNESIDEDALKKSKKNYAMYGAKNEQRRPLAKSSTFNKRSISQTEPSQNELKSRTNRPAKKYTGNTELVLEDEIDMHTKDLLEMEVIDENITEAKYKGKTVTLNKPMRGDSKKFKVYVNSGKKNADGSIKVKKVNFGHGGTSAKKRGEKTMKIRKSNPKARKAFRARHNCDNPGPKTMARYWSCKKW